MSMISNNSCPIMVYTVRNRKSDGALIVSYTESGNRKANDKGRGELLTSIIGASVVGGEVKPGCLIRYDHQMTGQRFDHDRPRRNKDNEIIGWEGHPFLDFFGGTITVVA